MVSPHFSLVGLWRADLVAGLDCVGPVGRVSTPERCVYIELSVAPQTHWHRQVRGWWPSRCSWNTFYSFLICIQLLYVIWWTPRRLALMWFCVQKACFGRTVHLHVKVTKMLIQICLHFTRFSIWSTLVAGNHSIALSVFLFSFILTELLTMATDHQIPASKQQQPGSSAFKVGGNLDWLFRCYNTPDPRLLQLIFRLWAQQNAV